MRVVTRAEFINNTADFLDILENGVFIYPTDTVYGIGCNATKPELVERVRAIKQSQDQPFSVIAPSMRWIYQHCHTTQEAEEYLQKLPGPYTLIMPVTNPNNIASNVALQTSTLGVRFPNNWFAKVVYDLDLPIVTTSANISGGDFMTDLEDLDPKLRKQVDLIIYDGPIKGRPSTIINLSASEIKVIKR